MWNAVFTHIKYVPIPVIAEPAIHLSSSNGWVEFWPEPMKFLVDMLNHAHWLRILNATGEEENAF